MAHPPFLGQASEEVAVRLPQQGVGRRHVMLLLRRGIVVDQRQPVFAASQSDTLSRRIDIF